MEWPRYIALKSATNNKYLSYVEAPEGIASSGDDVWKPSTKFDVELPNNPKLEYMFHIRCCCNKFLVCPVVAGSAIGFADKADEDDTKTSCTLFKFVNVNKDEGKIQIQHVGTKQYLQVKEDTNLVSGISASPTGDSSYAFEVIDGHNLIRMPEYVAFKGDNEKYLILKLLRGNNPLLFFSKDPYLQFSSDDKSDEEVVQRIFHNPEGSISIKNISADKFWAMRDEHWIRADTDQKDMLLENHFQPIRIDDTTVALKNLGNNKFCERSIKGEWDLLSAQTTNISSHAKFKMEELVLSRHIYDVRYRFDHARTYDNNSSIVGTGSVTNKDDYEKEFQVKIAIKYTNTRSWKNSFKWDLGVKATVEGNIFPLIREGKFEFSATSGGTSGGTRELGEIESDDVQFETTVTEKVPKNSRCTVNAIAKVAEFDIPYSYQKRDVLYDGTSNTASMHDGVYNGFHFVEINHETVHQPLPPED